MAINGCHSPRLDVSTEIILRPFWDNPLVICNPEIILRLSVCCGVVFECWYPWWRVFLQNIALEAAFPHSAITRMQDCDVKKNEIVIGALRDGLMYHNEIRWWWLTAGSRGETLALEDSWGHPPADTDMMHINGGPMGVYVAGGQEPRGQSCLEFSPQGCPAAYCKLEVTDINRLRDCRVDHGDREWCDDSSVDESDGKQWLNSYNAVRKMKASVESQSHFTVSGPASQHGLHETIQTLVCSSPHPDLHEEFQTRQRGSWPAVSLIKYILQLPMLLVLVGHKGSPESEFKQQARMSWSHLELKLIQGLPENVRQGYIACKYAMKRFLGVHRGQNEAADGRSRVCCYHIKVAFLRFLEKRPPSQITSPFALFLDLLRELDEYLKVGNLPHYFLAECNLLETTADDERGIARQVIAKILSDPLNAILTSPTDPQEIYGEVRPDDLVTAFHGVSSHHTHEQYQKLSELLARVDERRRQRYKEQRGEDKRNRVSGRAPTRTLRKIFIRQNIW